MIVYIYAENCVRLNVLKYDMFFDINMFQHTHTIYNTNTNILTHTNNKKYCNIPHNAIIHTHTHTYTHTHIQ